MPLSSGWQSSYWVCHYESRESKLTFPSYLAFSAAHLRSTHLSHTHAHRHVIFFLSFFFQQNTKTLWSTAIYFAAAGCCNRVTANWNKQIMVTRGSGLKRSGWWEKKWKASYSRVSDSAPDKTTSAAVGKQQRNKPPPAATPASQRSKWNEPGKSWRIRHMLLNLLWTSFSSLLTACHGKRRRFPAVLAAFGHILLIAARIQKHHVVKHQHFLTLI